MQARLYVLVEYISQFYRALAPITQWGMFLYASYSGLEVISGFLFCTLYVFCKIFELAERGKSLKKAISTFRRNIVSSIGISLQFKINPCLYLLAGIGACAHKGRTRCC